MAQQMIMVYCLDYMYIILFNLKLPKLCLKIYKQTFSQRLSYQYQSCAIFILAPKKNKNQHILINNNYSFNITRTLPLFLTLEVFLSFAWPSSYHFNLAAVDWQSTMARRRGKRKCCSRPNWLNLGREVLDLVPKNLALVGLVRFQAVCSSWSSVVKSYMFPHHTLKCKQCCA